MKSTTKWSFYPEGLIFTFRFWISELGSKLKADGQVSSHKKAESADENKIPDDIRLRNKHREQDHEDESEAVANESRQFELFEFV